MELNEEEVQWEVAGTVSSVEGFVTIPSAFTGYRTHAHHPKKLEKEKIKIRDTIKIRFLFRLHEPTNKGDEIFYLKPITKFGFLSEKKKPLKYIFIYKIELCNTLQ